jgi:hypothetical protein
MNLEQLPERIGLHGNDMTQLKRQCPIDLSCNQRQRGANNKDQYICDKKLTATHDEAYLEIELLEMHVVLPGPPIW